MAVAIWIVRRTEYFGGRVGAIRADPELAGVLVKRGDAQFIERGVKLQKIDKSHVAPPPEPNEKKEDNGKAGGKGKKAPKPKPDPAPQPDPDPDPPAEPVPEPEPETDPAPSDDA